MDIDDPARPLLSFAPRFFDDPAFTSSFTQSFLDFALSRNSDPNAKFDDGNLTPRWNRYTSFSKFEMVFNRTDGEELDIRPASTSAGLLERCAYVLLSCSFWRVNILNHQQFLGECERADGSVNANGTSSTT